MSTLSHSPGDHIIENPPRIQMEVDNRKNEARADLKYQDIMVEVCGCTGY